jgi:hypothetical protein
MAKRTKYQLNINLAEAVGRLLDSIAYNKDGLIPVDAPEIAALIETYNKWLSSPPALPKGGVQNDRD